MSKVNFNDFSGGLTDLPFNTASNYSEIMDNLVALRDKSMEVRYGFEFYDTSTPRVTSNQRVSSIEEISGLLVLFSNGDAYYPSGTMQKLSTPSTGPLFNLYDVNSMVDVAKHGDNYIAVNDSLSHPVKLFKDSNGNLKGVNAGLPRPSSGSVVTPSSITGGDYIYAVVYEYTYVIGSTTYLDLGEPLYIETDGPAFGNGDGSSVDITNIPELTNGNGRNYDLPNIKKRIYRSLAGSTTLHLVDTIDNTASAYTDTTSNADLAAKEILYTNGGVLPNHMPPAAKYITIANNVAWYGNVVESAENKPYRLRFSKIADFDSCPDTFFEDFETEIMGLAATEERVLVFTKRNFVRLEGVLDDFGRGLISRDIVADVGCIANGSIVSSEEFVYWWSPSGIYRTNGIKEQKLTEHLDASYLSWIEDESRNRRISAAYDKANKRVYWCFNKGSSDNDTILVYDEINGGFTTMSSGEDFSPTALLFKGKEMIRADHDGYLFAHREDVYSDLIKDNFKAPSDWNTKAIPYEWKHIAWDMGDSESQKWITRINVGGRPKTNLYLEMRSYREGGVDYYALDPVRFNPLIKWGDASILWGQVANYWNATSYMNQSKRMHRKAKRASHVQMSVGSAYVKIMSSVKDTDSQVVVSGGSRTISQSNPATYKFALNMEGYDVIIDGKSYEIESGSDTALIVKDPEGTLPLSGIYEYEIKGYPKDQRPHISNMAIHFEFFGNSDKLKESDS